MSVGFDNNDVLSQVFGTNGFAVDSVSPQNDFEVIPPCKPVCLIDSVEIKKTKAGTGHYVKVALSIVEDGPHKGRKLWDQINIDNPEPKCVEIGLRTLAALGKAVGINVINNQTFPQIAGKLCVPHVKVRDDQNVIRTYSPVGNYAPVPAAVSNAPQPYQAPRAQSNSQPSSTPPWMR